MDIKELQNESAALRVALTSRYSAYGHIEPSLEMQKIMIDRIYEINEEIKHRYLRNSTIDEKNETVI